MQIVPVIDILDAVVVRGVGGRRSNYRPIQSLLTASTSPTPVLNALLDCFQFQTAYVADLDGIMTSRLNLDLHAELARRPVELVVDAGIKSADDARRLVDVGIHQVVAASESLPSRAILTELIGGSSPERIVFSMDLKCGWPLVAADEWKDRTPEAIIDDAVGCGVTRFILLDLADVGEGRGMSTLPLLMQLRNRQPDCWFAIGGGVRTVKDVRMAESAGADAVLVSSALHDGRIAPSDVKR